MSDSLRSLSTNQSIEGQVSKKKKVQSTSSKTNRPQNISYNELVDLLHPNHLFINISLEDKFNAIEILESAYFPNFKFVVDENLEDTEVKWKRLPSFIKLTT
ncbi:unnamed protein product (macronuclear) [Paramecium tetraurelia]|uniref:Uncharacterized protein n=1 Tax=Paramecium tetraurelia TaxID=5888 RepID=A0BVG3_PARTE|nr:uncharacterized protein GSPATT00005776001 [Paramecium tetraurelia]CAK62530.1 unnamed protein product [Paramecium tetraurelia]|eukprot:XP_001429928.1 hypothetical protein (macronuclear) [Paramecium tetraurelia strain d4-2]